MHFQMEKKISFLMIESYFNLGVSALLEIVPDLSICKVQHGFQQILAIL